MTNVCSGEIKAPFNLQTGVRLDLLGDQFAKMNDSVKFFEPTTTWLECGGEQESSGAAIATISETAKLDGGRIIERAGASQAIPRRDQPPALRHRRNRSCKNDPVVNHGQAAKDELAQTTGANRRCDGGQAHGNHDGHTNTRQITLTARGSSTWKRS